MVKVTEGLEMEIMKLENEIDGQKILKEEKDNEILDIYRTVKSKAAEIGQLTL